MSPQTKTSLAVAIPVLLTILHFVAPKFTPADAVAVVTGALAVAQGIQGVVNVFHVSSKVKGVLGDIVDWASTVKAAIPPGTLAEAKRLADGASATVAVEEKKS